MITCDLGGCRAWFTDRWGGVSAHPYDNANVADHVGDDDADVAENRRRLAARLAAADDTVPADPSYWQWLVQVHGRDIISSDGPLSAPPEPMTADGAVTSRPGRPLVVMTADCAPVVLAADNAVAVVHAGWPGLAAGVVEAGVEALRALTNAPIRAVLGPCVHPRNYEFGDLDLARLVDRLGPEVASKTAAGTAALDIPAAVRAALERVGGVRLDDVGVCTAELPDYFSHRRDGTTGRQAVIAMRS